MHNGKNFGPKTISNRDGSKRGWKKLFAFTQRSHLLAFLPGLVLAAGAGILEPVVAIILGKFFDAITEFGVDKISPDMLMERNLFSVYVLVGIGTGTLLLKGGMFAAWLAFGELQAKSVRDKLFEGFLAKDMEWYETVTTDVGALMARLQTQTRDLQASTSQSMGFIVTCVVEGFAALGLSFWYHWKLTFVILASLPVSAVVLHFISRGLETNVVKQNEELSRASTMINNIMTNISQIKYFNTQEQESRQYGKVIRQAALFYGRQARSSAMQMGYVRFAATTMFVQGFWYGSIIIHKGELTPGKAVTTFWACLMAVQAFQDILPFVLVLEKGRNAAVTLVSLLESVKRGPELKVSAGGRTPRFCEGDIEVREVSFSYPSRPDHAVLQQSTFFFPAGETTFIVGRSGSGKSTLGNLLSRFYPPNSGYIRIDGHNLEDLDTHWLRNNITLVQQQSILFNETMFQNIALGHQQYHRTTHSQVKPCLELAALQETITELPRGVETRVGSGGSALSGGQKQRVAIARARLRNTPVLILDESTSALDNVSRTRIMEAVRTWRSERTTIIITHDLQQIKDHDFVYMLQNGRIIAEGYHSDLTNDIKRGNLESPITSPTVANSFHFDFDSLGSDRRSNRLSIRRRHNHRTTLTPRKDSLEAYLDTTYNGQSAQQELTAPTLTRVSRYIGNRFSVMIGTVFEDNSNHTGQTHETSPDDMIPVQNITNHRVPQVQRRMTVRPISIHQAVVMRSILAEKHVDKSLPIPQVVDMPQFLRRFSTLPIQQELQTQQAPKRPSVQKILATIWPALDRKRRLQLILGFVAVCVHAGVTPAFSYVLIQLFQTFYMANGYQQKSMKYSIAILGIAIIDGIASFYMKYLLELAGQAWVDWHRREAVKRILEQPKSWFDEDTITAASVLSSLDRNAEEMRNLLGRFAALIFVVIVMMTVSVIWSVVTCWKISLVALGAGPLLYLLTKGFDMVTTFWESRINTAGDHIATIFMESFSDIRTVRSLTLESYFHRKYTQATSSAFSIGLNRAMYTGLFYGLSDSAIHYLTALIFWYGAYLAKTHAFTTKAVLESFSLLLFSTAAANGVIAYMPQLASSVDTGSRLLQLAQLPLRSHEYSGRFQVDSEDPAALAGPISFINLTFTYPSRPDNPVLRCLNMTIPVGVCTALVGASGSGKSTIANLLMGLYPPMVDPSFHSPSDPSTGPPSLTIAGRDIRTLHIPTLRQLMAVVPQTPVLFSATVRDNLTYGLALNSPLSTTENVEAAAQRAGIHDFILSLPQKYETVIGEGGLGVSGGQAQRIVIARALLRKPRVLILDEATSALDRESTNVIKASIKKLLLEGREASRQGHRSAYPMTVLIITHAKEMMSFADNIIMLESGQAVEQGGYKELLERKGKFWQMLYTLDRPETVI